MDCADAEANPSALSVPRNSQGTSPDLSRSLAPTEGAQAPAAASTTNDSSEEQPPLGTAVGRRSRGTRPHYRSAPAPVSPCRYISLPSRHSVQSWAPLFLAAIQLEGAALHGLLSAGLIVAFARTASLPLLRPQLLLLPPQLNINSPSASLAC